MFDRSARWILPVLVACALAGFATVRSLRHTPESRPRVDLPAQRTRSRAEFSVPPAAQDRRKLMYPYSVVPGGVGSAAELKEAAAKDSVVQEHYKDFHYDRAQVVRLEADRQAYVSYRTGSDIFWTRRKVTLKKGEVLLTDGQTTIRGRCGNQVCETSQSPVARGTQPAIADMDTPLAETASMPELTDPPLLGNLDTSHDASVREFQGPGSAGTRDAQSPGGSSDHSGSGPRGSGGGPGSGGPGAGISPTSSSLSGRPRLESWETSPASPGSPGNLSATASVFGIAADGFMLLQILGETSSLAPPQPGPVTLPGTSGSPQPPPPVPNSPGAGLPHYDPPGDHPPIVVKPGVLVLPPETPGGGPDDPDSPLTSLPVGEPPAWILTSVACALFCVQRNGRKRQRF